MQQSIGVVIGRFQVDEITAGHLQLLTTVLNKHSALMILLGCCRSAANRDNPLNYRIREQMLRELYPNAVILPVFDCPTDAQWSKQVDQLIWSAFPRQDATLYGGRDSFIPHYKGSFTTRQLDFGSDQDDPTSGTSRRIFLGCDIRSTSDFRAGVIHALMTLPPQVVPCVDILMYKVVQEQIWVLLGRKADEVGWRIPGGHVDMDDKDYAAAARRELYEETKMACEAQPTFVGSFAVDDWRLRSRTDVKYFTALFVVPYNHGTPEAGDDLNEVGWFTIDVATNTIIDDHSPLIKAAKDYLTPDVSFVRTHDATY